MTCDATEARSILAYARAEHTAVLAETIVLVGYARALAIHAGREVADVVAERRIVGWMLTRAARAEDFASLDAGDFTDDVIATLYVIGLSALHVGQRPTVDMMLDMIELWPWPNITVDDVRHALPMIARPASVPTDEINTVRILARWRRGR